MIRRICLIAMVMVLACGVASADFTYEQTSKITGGAIMNMVKVMGAFSKQMREPMRSTVTVKGDRMAMIGPQMTQIIDLSAETMTEVNHQKKQYSVITFAQWAEAMKNLDAKIKDEAGKEKGEITVRGKVQQPGDTKVVNGVNAKHAILTIEFEGQNDKGEKGVFMTMVSDMWMTPEIQGYSEVRRFYEAMAAKMNWSPSSGMISAMAPGSNKGMAEMMKEMAKLEGVPAFQVVKMVMGTPEQAEAALKQQQAQQASSQQQSNAEVEKPNVGGALGRIAGGRLGRFGGFGRKKQEEQPQQTEQQNAPAAQEGAPPSGYLMEMTSELTGFSQAAVDGAKLEVPGGYKQVESDTLKNMKRR
ncbi:MAG TPA: hypothetical protein VN428_07415 [Bryobacteraceae bacterium]|nr:hypothetical protein [Bryobacteraceae bacterium]